MGSSSGGNAGYRYFFGIHAGMGRGPVDQLLEIRVGTKLAWQGPMTESGTSYIDAPNLFGGDSKEGGVVGPFNLMMGEPTQVMPAALAQMISPIPATGYRRRVTLFFDGMVSALTPYPKPWTFRVRRILKGWDGEVFRPDLALIVLEGPNTNDAVYQGDVLLGDQPFVGPNISPIQITIPAPPGMTITSFRYATSDFGGGVTQNIFPTNTVINGDGSMTLDFKPSMYGYYAYIGFMVAETSEIQSAYGIVNQVPNPIQGLAAVSGYFITEILPYAYYVDEVSGLQRNFEILAVIYNPDGTALLSLAPLVSVTQGLTVAFRFVGSTDIEQTVVYFDRVSTPAGVTIVPPAGGTLLDVISLTWTAPDANGENWYPGQTRQIAFTQTGNAITYNDALTTGGNMLATYRYKAGLGSTAGGRPVSQIYAMNPAHMIFECLTNREWGRGFDRSVINQSSFAAAATTLKNEAFGLCTKWGRTDSIESFIQEILDTIGAALRPDATGLYELKLIRADYDASVLPLWDTTNGIKTITSSKVTSSTMQVNEIIVQYRDPVFNEDRSVNVQNLASLQSNRGAFNSMTKSYPSIPTTGLARRAAQRDLRAFSDGLRRFSLVMDRRGSSILPGDVMKIQDVSRGILPTVVRVATRKNSGGNSGEISFEVVQDVFGFPEKSFVADQPPAWQPANFTPCIGEHEVFEVPYFLLSSRMRPADFAYVDNESAYLGTVSEQAKSTNVGYDIAVRTGAPTEDDWPSDADALYCGYTPPSSGLTWTIVRADSRVIASSGPNATTVYGYAGADFIGGTDLGELSGAAGPLQAVYRQYSTLTDPVTQGVGMQVSGTGAEGYTAATIVLNGSTYAADGIEWNADFGLWIGAWNAAIAPIQAGDTFILNLF